MTSSTERSEVFHSIFKTIDRLFQIVRPRKLLYIAIDGQAPTAKMKGPRCKHSTTPKQDEIEEDVGDLPESSCEVSNPEVIRPRTKFMKRLLEELKCYIHSRMAKDPSWKDIKVILSGVNVPGEAEDKIMSFIRLQRNRNGYNPNTHHCVYGMDADLIMLALATHEIHFSILREGPTGREQQLCCASLDRTQYQFLNIWKLREYLELDMTIAEPPKDFLINFERIVDDFIFLCFFLGNDFLPHLPSLEIRKGALDLLMAVYKEEFKNMGGYLVDTHQFQDENAAYINFERVQQFILAVGSYEKKSETWKVNLGSEGRKAQSSKEKFSVEKPDENGSKRKEIVQKYVEGLCWVLRYYFGAVCSWSWYYGNHDAPYASDFKGFDQSLINSAQLMAVLPPRGAHALPEADRTPMTCSESKAHPPGFKVDKDGKQYMQQTITEADIEKRMFWHEHYGNQQRESRGIQGRKNGGFGQPRYVMLARLRAEGDDSCRSNSQIPEALENDSRADRSDNWRSTPQPPEAPDGSRADRSDNWRSTQLLAAPGNISRADRSDNWRSTSQPLTAPGNGSRADVSDNWRSTQFPAAPRNGSRADMSDNWRSTSQPPAGPTYQG